jgi:hypothetical protein
LIVVTLMQYYGRHVRGQGAEPGLAAGGAVT